MEPMNLGKWSFDDYGIGWVDPGKRHLASRPLKRPSGYTNKDWYTLASRTIHTKDSRLMGLPELDNVMQLIDNEMRGHYLND